MLPRRRLLKYASVLALMAMQAKGKSTMASADFSFRDYPFALGVASGDPVTDGFVLWTRLAPRPMDIYPLTTRAIPVRWEVAIDEKMRRVLQSGYTCALPEHAHSVHVEVQGLAPDRPYFYRFIAGKHASPIGKTCTLPLIGKRVGKFRFAYASCQDISNGYFAAYHDMVERDPALVIHTGDYIYESVYRDGGRRIPVPEAFSLEDYRLLHARYKLDRDLQRAHSQLPWLCIWDDHEVENDWGGQFSESIQDPERFLARKTAAIKAYYEHMPMRLSSRLLRGESRIFKRTFVGDLLEFNLLDCRQYRDPPPCRDARGHVPKMIDDCPEARRNDRSMLGEPQETWLRRGLGHQGQVWTSIVQTSYMAPFDYLKGDGTEYKTDGWDGYASTRQRILDLIVRKKLRNVVALGGEIHAAYAGIVTADPYDFDSPPVLTELICTSLSSGGGAQERYDTTHALFSDNPFARFFDNRYRGYTLCDVTREQWQATLRVSSDVRDPNATFSTLQKLTIENGKAEVNL